MSLGGDTKGAALVGRARECAVIRHALDQARAHRSAVIALRGEAGSGKTALLDFARDHAADFQVARVVGVQAEMELPFAGLHQLSAPLLEGLDRLPPPQRTSLEVTFGLRDGAPPDRFLNGLAVLTLLTDAAEERPLLCLVDDAQWLDRASMDVLHFAFRRLAAEPIGVLLALRDDAHARMDLADLATLAVPPLEDADARQVLRSALPGRLDEQVELRMIAEARGNPLALTELPLAMTPTEMAGGYAVPVVPRTSAPIERTFRRRLESLPEESRLLVLAAAAEPVGDVQVLVRAAQALGVETTALHSAQAEGLLEIGQQVRFRHPLVRSTVYQDAPAEDRRRVHRALAIAVDAEQDTDRRAWHRAHAAEGPDDEVAAELERCARGARARGGVAAAAAFLEQAAMLSADADHLCRRALDAAELKIQAGATEAAARLLALVQDRSSDPWVRGRSHLLRGHLAFATDHGAEAATLLLAAAQELQGLDLAAAREAYLEALLAGIFAGRLAVGAGAVDVARAALSFPAPDAPQATDLLLAGVARLFTDGHAAARATLRRAIEMVRGPETSREHQVRLLPLSCTAAVELWDDESWLEDTALYVDVVRASGALSELPFCLNHRSVALSFAGDLTAAEELVDQSRAILAAGEGAIAPYGTLAVAAWRGREAETREVAAACIADVTRRGEGIGLTVAHWALALLYNGLGRYEEALVEAEASSAFSQELSSSYWGRVELVEAAVRTGTPERARDALGRLSAAAGAVQSDWALGVAARSRALVTDAEEAYREAVERLGRTRMRADLARAHLVFGEWLRRQQRRSEARVQLRTAVELLEQLGIDAFADRAVRELRATGDKVVDRRAADRVALTAQEAQIARCAREGLSNREIGARLFLSGRTVEWHLGHVFAKLGISSRRELLLGRGGQPL